MDSTFFKSLIIYGGSAGLSRILPILMLPIYVKTLGTSSYGEVEVIFSLFNFLLILGMFQFETALQRRYYLVSDNSVGFYSLFIIVSLISIIVAVLSTALSNNISLLLFDSQEQAETISTASFTIVFANISTLCLIFFRYNKQAKIFAFLNIGQVMITAALTYVFVVNCQYGKLGYFYGIFSGWLFVALLGMFLIGKQLKLRWEMKEIYESFLFSYPQFPARIASFFFQFGNRFVVLYILGATSVAIMSISLKFAAIFQLIMLALSMAWNPFLYSNENNSDLNNNVNRIFKYLLAFLLIMHVLTLYIAEPLINNFFSDDLYMSIKYVGLAIIPIQLLIVKDIVESGIRLANKTKLISYAYFISTVVTVAFMLLSKSVEEVLLSTILGTLVLVVASWFYSEKVYSLKYNRKYFVIYLGLISLTTILFYYR